MKKKTNALTEAFFGKQKEIAIEKYKKLSEEEKKNYKGVYKTKKKRVSSNCSECGHSTGWHTENVNIGKPISYKEKSFYDVAFEKMAMDIILNQDKQWKVTEFPTWIKFKGFDKLPD